MADIRRLAALGSAKSKTYLSTGIVQFLSEFLSLSARVSGNKRNTISVFSEEAAMNLCISSRALCNISQYGPYAVAAPVPIVREIS